jgi:hypothetical protein
MDNLMTKKMKKNKLYIILGFAVLTCVSACKKTDLYPYNEIEVTQSFKTIKDAQAWDAGIMAQFRKVHYDDFRIYQDLAADQLNAVLDNGNNGGNPHRWDASFNNTDGALLDIWSGYYEAIANTNVAIEGYATVPTSTSEEQAALNKCYGDAYLARAYFYHCLVLRWAKPYEIATAASNPGVPLVLKYDIKALPARASVQAVYTQIIDDLSKAQTLLAGINTGSTAASRAVFSMDAAKALEARVKLSMHDNAAAYSAANSLISSGKYPLINSQAAFTAYWTNDTYSESILQLAVNPMELPDVRDVYLNFIPSNSKYNPRFIPSQWVVDRFSADDIRKSTYFKQLPVVVQGIDYPNTWCITKYPGNPELFTSQYSNYANAVKTFRIGEIYCIAAEAAAADGNDGNALTAINALRNARGLTGLSSSGTVLMSDIKEERTRELAFEGVRLYDLARWHSGFTRRAPQNPDMLVQGSNYFTLSIAADAQKFQWGIPANDMLINKNLVQNPGW